MASTLTDDVPDIRLQAIRSSDRPNVLWGAGWAAVLTKSFLVNHGIHVDAVVVDRPIATGAVGPSIPAEGHYTPLQTAERFRHINLICGFYTRSITGDFSAKATLLQSLGCDVIPYAFDVHLMMYPERAFPPDFVATQAAGLSALNAMLADDLSKATLDAFIRQRVSMRYGPLELLMVDHQYFPETVYRLRNDEVYFDCGAYDGDTIADFRAALERQRGQATYEAIVAFEPNREPFERLCTRLAADPAVTCINKGVWNESTELRFSTGRLRSSKIDDHGDAVIQLDTIDAMVPDYPCSLIKLDLEGAELQALQGAEGVIRRYRPKIAVCVYHKSDDLVTIPSWLRSLDLPYRYYLRAHEAKSSEVVFYCIPQ